jgi:TPR repeat protein
MSTTAASSLPDSICANCGKSEESSGDLKACTACKMVKYCNRDCQIAHRSQHKKACKKRAAELHDAELFKVPPPPEDCPICMQPPPIYENHTGMTFHSCCGKNICSGCGDKMNEIGAGNLCPFCRTPCPTSDEEAVNRLKKLLNAGKADAFNMLAVRYEDGSMGLPQDRAKANELYLKGGGLGCAQAYFNLGNQYYNGRGVEINEKKAMHYYELAAMNGNSKARHNLGATEYDAGKYHRAMKHFVISACVGCKGSLDAVKDGYMAGYVAKDEYANTLREYQKSQDEMKSEARDKALAARNQIRHG